MEKIKNICRDLGKAFTIGLLSGGAAAHAAEASVAVSTKVKAGAKVLDDKGSVALDRGSKALGKQLGRTKGMFKSFAAEYKKAAGTPAKKKRAK